MPNVMAALLNIGGALYKSSLIPFLVPRRKAWLTPTARVLCSNAANTGKRKTWTQSEFCTWPNSVRGQQPQKCMCSVQAHETAKHHAKCGWPPLSNIAAVTKSRRETRWNVLECAKLANRSQPLVGRSSPYCENMWGRYCCSTIYQIVDICFSCKGMPNRVVWWCADGDSWRFVCVLYFQRAACSTFQTCILNSH